MSEKLPAVVESDSNNYEKGGVVPTRSCVVVEDKVVAAYFLDPRLGAVAAQLLEQFKELAPEPGAKVRFGWSEIVLKEQGDELVLCEPDYAHPGLQGWVADVSRSLRLAAEQGRLHQGLGVSVCPCSYRDRVIAPRGVLELEKLFMHRHSAARRGSSGWYLGPVDAGGIQNLEESEPLFSAHLLTRRPELAIPLCLPEGYMVMVEGGRLVEIRDAEGNLSTLQME